MGIEEWVILIVAAIIGILVMGHAIENFFFKTNGKDIFGDDDYSDMDSSSTC